MKNDVEIIKRQFAKTPTIRKLLEDPPWWMNIVSMLAFLLLILKPITGIIIISIIYVGIISHKYILYVQAKRLSKAIQDRLDEIKRIHG